MIEAKENITLLIADDHPMILKGLNEELRSNGYNVIGQASNGIEALEMILRERPILALLDIDMPYLTGLEVVKMAREKGVSTKFVLLSFHKEMDYIMQAKTLQIYGYLLKEDSFTEIEKCIEAVLDGESYYSPSFNINDLENAGKGFNNLQLLTPSEITILKLVSEQKTNIQIAEILFVSSRTIEKHRSNIIDKLQLNGTKNSLINWALTNRELILNM